MLHKRIMWIIIPTVSYTQGDAIMKVFFLEWSNKDVLP